MVSMSVVNRASAKPNKQNNIIQSDKDCCCQFECKWSILTAHFHPRNGHGIEWKRCSPWSPATSAPLSCYVSTERDHVLAHLSWFYGFNSEFWSRVGSAINCFYFCVRSLGDYILICKRQQSQPLHNWKNLIKWPRTPGHGSDVLQAAACLYHKLVAMKRDSLRKCIIHPTWNLLEAVLTSR